MESLIILVVLVGGVMWLINLANTSSKPPRISSQGRNDRGLRLEVAISDAGSSWNRVSPRNLSEDFDEFWVPQGRTIAVQGYSIDGGLLYVGKNLASVNGYQIEPALINPNLSVDHKHPDHEGTGMGYWPSYDGIPARCRSAYLAWLAGGRKDPNAYIGYVFLYFYGLERRILHDHWRGSVSKEERLLIFNEVKRLLKLYRDNGSFSNYAQGFLFAMYLGSGDVDLTEKPPVVLRRSYDIPAPLKVGLGQFAKAARPIPADWALAWVLQNPEIRLRTPARRCRQEFGALFKHLYRERYDKGMVVKPNKTPVSVTYRPASGGIRGSLEIYKGPTLPDITVLKRPRTILTDLAEMATDKLDAYSRFIGNDGSGRDSLQGLALLPSELDGQAAHSGLEALRDAIEPHLEDRESALVPAKTILEHFPINKPDRLSKKEAVLLAQLLEKLGLGMEPDVRFSGIKPKPDDKLLVFRQDQDAPSAPSQAFEAATLVMRLAAMVSAADSEVSPDEERHLEEHIEASLSLEAGERRRLRANMQWLLAHDQSMAGLKSKLEGLAKQQRESIGEYLVTVAAADGHIDPGEVKILQKLYKRLGLDPDQVISELHGASAGPITVRPATPQPGHTIPEPPKEPIQTTTEAGRSALDPTELQRKLADTARVSELLHGIFADEQPEDDVAQTPQTDTSDSQAISGLDVEHSVFLRALGDSEAWERPALEALADRHGLLLEGALDTINEAAFDHCDAPCIEEDDDVYVVDRQIYEEMTT